MDAQTISEQKRVDSISDDIQKIGKMMGDSNDILYSVTEWSLMFIEDIRPLTKRNLKKLEFQ